MAVVLRSSSDLVYLPDHGFVGEEGALRILAQITRQICRLDVSHNLLGPEGTLILIQGLNSLRGQFSSSDFGIWGLTEINLGHNGITDAAVDALLGYAKKDVMLRKIYLQGNTIELKTNIDSFVNSLNSSRLEMLSLTDNKRLVASSLSRLFDTLSTPYLHELHLSICGLGAEIAAPIAQYLQSPRSRNLRLLGLNANHFGADAISHIVDAVERGNFTISHLGLLANSVNNIPSDAVQDGSMTETVPPPRAEERQSTSIDFETSRIPPLLKRNETLAQRVQLAALRCLPRARILLNAQFPSPLETARAAMESVSLRSHTPHFRLLDLPREIIYLIVRHTSQDATALSDAQYTRLRKDAEGGEGLRRAVRMTQSKTRGWVSDADTMREIRRELREDWIRSGKWDKWENNVRSGKE